MKKILLFDVDGTLTKSRQKIQKNMLNTLKQVQKKYAIGIVSGSDLPKIYDQLGQDFVNEFDYCFSQNGLQTLKNGQIFKETSFLDKIGEQNYKEFINYCLRYLSEIDIPVKRGIFIELRIGLVNISPIGRNCSQQERDDFEKFDKEHKIREKFISNLQQRFSYLNLQYSIGGQISFDVFPNGWDKTYCLQYLDDYEQIYFFGDKTRPVFLKLQGGNDYELFIHERTNGIAVASYEETIKILQDQFLL